MIPIGDDDTSRRTAPVVTYALIALNVLFFFVEQSGGDAFVGKWALVPKRFLANPFGGAVTLFTSMFMHAGWVHLGGNMLYLWIFGDNVEDRFGHLKFTMFYLLCGLAATFAQLAFSVGSSVPNLGASGAIAGVLGAYILLFPQRKDQSATGPTSDSSARVDRHWNVDRSAVLQRHWFHCQYRADRRRRVHGAHRRIPGGVCTDVPASWKRKGAGGGLSGCGRRRLDLLASTGDGVQPWLSRRPILLICVMPGTCSST